jgi:hypothetical protein
MRTRGLAREQRSRERGIGLMRKFIVLGAVVGAFALTSTANAAAGCRAWGQGDVAALALAQTGGVGSLVSDLASSGVQIGVVVAAEHEATCP